MSGVLSVLVGDNSSGGIGSPVEFVSTFKAVASNTVQPTKAVPTGSLIVACIATSGNASATVTITDTQSNTYTSIQQVTNPASAATAAMLYCYNCNALSVSDTITIVPHCSTGFDISMIYVTGAKTVSTPLDASNFGSGTTTPWQSGNVTSTATGELFVGWVCASDNSIATQSSGFSTPPTAANGYLFDRGGSVISTATATKNYSAATGGALNWAAILACFKPA